MKTDSPAAINAAIETAREGEPSVGDTCRANWHAANELLARELVRLIDAGELVRVVPARIEMEGEAAAADDIIRDLRRKLAEVGVEGSPPPGGQGTIPMLLARAQDAEEQVRMLRTVLCKAAVPLEGLNASVQWELAPAIKRLICETCEEIRAALAATAPTPTEDRT